MTRSPPFRADHVGSLIRPPALIEAHTAHLQGKLPLSELRALEDTAIDERVRLEAITMASCAATTGETVSLSS